MRKMLAVLLLVCALGLFAQIPAGTKSVAVLTGSTSDFLAEEGDFEFGLQANVGYFIMDALEIDAILGVMNYGDMEFELGLGALYHMPLSPMLGLYLGGAFVFGTSDVMVVEDDVPELKESTMDIPIDVGLELFLTENNAVRIANRFNLSLIGEDATDQIIIGTVHYFQ
jgi:hypothetical protein